MATKITFRGENVGDLRYMVVQRTCKTFGMLSGAHVDASKSVAWVEYSDADMAAKCADFMVGSEEVDGEWLCQFQEAEFPELPPLKPKHEDPFKKRPPPRESRSARSPPRPTSNEECFDFKVGRCTRGDRCRFNHVEGDPDEHRSTGARGDREKDEDDDRDRSRRERSRSLPRRDRDRERERESDRDRDRRDRDRDRGGDRDRERRRRRSRSRS